MNKLKLVWNNPHYRAFIYQVILLSALGFVVYYIFSNTLHNLSVRNIKTGFDFLDDQAGFRISEQSIAYETTDTYGLALIVGIINTLKVSFWAIFLSTLLGTLIGLARLSPNWLLNKISVVYVELIRNVPLLLQLLFWYTVITDVLPGPRQALNPIDGVFMSNRGLMFPGLLGDGLQWLWVAAIVWLVLTIVWSKYVKRRRKVDGLQLPVFSLSVVALLILLAIGYLIGSNDITVSTPALKGFNFDGGIVFSPELLALLLGLTIYNAAFVAEIVRAGIQNVDKGQWEAAGAIGLRRSLVLRLVVLPQALRSIIPSMTSTYLNVVKNSSLAVAIGYPDFVSIANTMMNKNGQAIEAVALIMAAYLTVSLSISLIMNWYNKRVALIER